MGNPKYQVGSISNKKILGCNFGLKRGDQAGDAEGVERGGNGEGITSPPSRLRGLRQLSNYIIIFERVVKYDEQYRA